jgi:hypothetical protein
MDGRRARTDALMTLLDLGTTAAAAGRPFPFSVDRRKLMMDVFVGLFVWMAERVESVKTRLLIRTIVKLLSIQKNLSENPSESITVVQCTGLIPNLRGEGCFDVEVWYGVDTRRCRRRPPDAARRVGADAAAAVVERPRRRRV